MLQTCLPVALVVFGVCWVLFLPAALFDYFRPVLGLPGVVPVFRVCRPGRRVRVPGPICPSGVLHASAILPRPWPCPFLASDVMFVFPMPLVYLPCRPVGYAGPKSITGCPNISALD